MKETKSTKLGRQKKRIALLQDGKPAMHFENIDKLAEFVGKAKSTIYKYISIGKPIQAATPLCNAVWTAAWEN